MIATKSLSKSFQSREINYPDFTTEKGDFILVCGDSGTGKSTLCEMIAGFLSQDSGSVLINGRDVRSQNVFESIHYVSQFPEHNLIGPTCYEEIDLWMQTNSSQQSDASAFIRDQLKEFYLAELVDKPIWKLSFGKKKALTFCAISTVKRNIWILDEPFAGLDKEITVKVKEMFNEFIVSGGTIVATSHTDKPFGEFSVKKVVLK